MKLLKIAPVLLFALVFVLTGCTANNPTAAGVPNEAAPAPDAIVQENVVVNAAPAADEAVAEATYITASEAESAALVHAGVPADAALGLRSEFDRFERTPDYDIDFCYDGTEYDYEINAVTGEVIKAERERCDHRHAKQVENTPDEGKTEIAPSAKPESADTASSAISRDQAKTIALEHAGLTESSVKRLEVEYDRDYGVYEWEVSFDHEGYEYDYDINAETGEIISYDKEWDD